VHRPTDYQYEATQIIKIFSHQKDLAMIFWLVVAIILVLQL